MNKLVADKLIDSIKFIPADVQEPLRLIKIQGTPELLVLTSSLGFFNGSEMNYIASGVLAREGIGINGTGFRYPTDELEPGEKPLEGVEVYNPLGEIQISVPIFERLMARYFRAFITEAEKAEPSIVRQTSWIEFIAATEEIERRTLRDESID